MTSTRRSRRNKRSANNEETESSMFRSIGGALRRAVTPIIDTFLTYDEKTDDNIGNDESMDDEEYELPTEIDATSFLSSSDNNNNNNNNKRGKRAISFEEAPSEGDTGAGIGLRLKAEPTAGDTSTKVNAELVDVEKLKFKGSYINNMKVAKIRQCLKSLGLPQEGRKDVLKNMLIAAVVQIHHSDPYANAKDQSEDNSGNSKKKKSNSTGKNIK